MYSVSFLRAFVLVGLISKCDFWASTDEKKKREQRTLLGLCFAQVAWKTSTGQVPFYADVRKLGCSVFRHLEAADLEGSISILCSSEDRSGTCG